MVAPKQDAHAADTDEDAEYLRPVITNTKEGEGEHHHENNGPEIDKLRRENGGVSVGKYSKVVTLHVKK